MDKRPNRNESARIAIILRLPRGLPSFQSLTHPTSHRLAGHGDTATGMGGAVFFSSSDYRVSHRQFSVSPALPTHQLPCAITSRKECARASQCYSHETRCTRRIAMLRVIPYGRPASQSKVGGRAGRVGGIHNMDGKQDMEDHQ